ncbi:MAG: hypothetical protein HY033_04900 [Ignavibacteriae bacterium]|nr:hypothetical protein [Ignavibacteria bacterium]MBI3364228.1 hypothetical protein [Ignavibacteriota bacterium]
MILSTTLSRAQHLSSARGMALGAYTASVADVSALDWNPAGLVSLRDWEVSTTSFVLPRGTGHSATFQLASIGKRFSVDHAAAFRLSPGTELEFIVPTTFIIQDSGAELKTEFDKKITYSERYALGYALRLNDRVSLGVSAHYIAEEVNDTRYELDTNSIVHSTILNYAGSAWSLDWGIQWVPDESWKIGIVAKNLFYITENPIAEEVRQYNMNPPKLMRIGASFGGVRNATLSVDGDTEQRYRFGFELNPLDALSLQAGLYLDGSSGATANALSFGIGTQYQNVQIALGYLAFLTQTNRRGEADILEFQRSPINDIEYNRFTSDRVSLTACVHIGRTRESLARIEYVEMLSEVFPVSKNVYAFRPIGKARVRNTSPHPIDAKVSFYADHIMDVPTESKPYTILPGEVKEIPFFAVFNTALHAVRSLIVEEGNVFVNAAPHQDYDDRYQARLLVRGKNDWNGDVTQLKYFVTPEDPDIVKFTRTVLSSTKSLLDTVPGPLQDFWKAKILFDEFTSRTVYVSDPKASADYVQYPAETLTLHGGDCDDMSVCFTSLLTSIGIPAAFVDVVPPDHPEDSHVYLLFDTGINPARAQLVSDNPKRYIIRQNSKGAESVWIPVETTALKQGFAEAWSIGAQEYFSDVELKLGLVKGWVHVIDFETIF